MNSTQFKESVKSLLSGYLDSKDAINYLALKITRLHESCSEKNGPDGHDEEVLEDDR